MDKYKLKNGMKVLNYNIDSFTSVYIAIIIKVGSRNETEEVAGLSHFLEHILFKGTKKYPKPFDLVRTVDKMGAVYNAYTSYDHTCYYINVANSYLENALLVLREMMFKSLFNEAEIKRERNVVIEELKKRSDMPNYFLGTKSNELIFKGNSLGRSVGGYEKVIKKLNKKIVIDYFKQYYYPENMSLVVVGKLPKNIKAVVNKFFNVQIKKVENTINSFKKFKITQNKALVKYYNINNNQTRISISFPFDYGFTDKKANHLQLLSNILGGNMSSLLFMEIREKKGLCYSIGSDITTYEDCGIFQIITGTQKKNIKKILIEIKKILKLIKKNGISKKNYDDGKINFINKFLVNIDNVKDIAGYYTNKLLYNDFDKIKDHTDYVNRLKKISLNGLNKIIPEIFDFNKMNVVIVN